jgi:hypothetical protein
MATHIRGAARVCFLAGKIVLVAALISWVAMAPLVWVLRDGLAAGMVETTGLRAVLKFSAGWGIPALVLTAFLAGLFEAERRLTPSQPADGD